MIYSITIAFALGIAFEEMFGFGSDVALLVVPTALAAFFVLYKDQKYFAKIILFVSLTFALGVLRIGILDQSPDINLIQNVGEEINLNAKIIAEPDERDLNTRYIIASENYKSKILLVAARAPQFDFGDKVQVVGKLDLPKNFQTDTGEEFDYVSFLSKDNVHYIIYQPQIALTEKARWGIRSALFKVKNIFIEKIGRVVPEPNAALLSGMIFGSKQSLGDELLEQFRNVGLIHIIVLSGYNITIIATGVFYLTDRIGKRNLGFVVSAIFTLLFGIMVGLGATVVRASIMALIAILARFLGRPADALRWLFIAGTAMLLWNPLSLLRDPSFQLSFMATLGLIVFSPFVYGFISKRFSFITEKLALREIVSSTIAVQIFILPLLVRMSGNISIISFLVNPLVLPLVPWVMGLGALTGAVGIFSGILSWIPGILSYILTEFIIKAVELSSALSLATISINFLSLWTIAIWYSFYGYLYLKLSKKVL